MTLISDIKSAMEKNKINDTVIKVLNHEHGKKVIEYFKSLGFDTRNINGNPQNEWNHYGVINGHFDVYKISHYPYVKIIELPTEESKAYEKQSLAFNPQPHYINDKGSIYKFCDDHNLNPWESDLIKRIVRCRKKGQFREDLEKTKDLIDLYLLECEQLNRLNP